jgi:hypothetical protein
LRARLVRRTAALALLCAASAAPAALIFDFNGALPGGPAQVTAFDWGPRSLLAKNANTAAANFANGGCATDARACEFWLYTHARLQGWRNAQGQLVRLGAGQGEITFVAGAAYVVEDLGMSPDALNLSFAPLGPGWLEMYWSEQADAHDLTGRGFGAGRLIGRFEGFGLGSARVLSINQGSAALDRFGTDDYPGQFTGAGAGILRGQPHASVGTRSVGLDAEFFLGALGASGARAPLAGVELYFEGARMALQFRGTNPSSCFAPSPSGARVGQHLGEGACPAGHVVGPFSAQPVVGGWRPQTGPRNAAALGPGPIDGVWQAHAPDFVSATDLNSGVHARAVPEPDSLALLGAAFVALGLAGPLRSAISRILRHLKFRRTDGSAASVLRK